mgnify:CR=1 FL=1
MLVKVNKTCFIWLVFLLYFTIGCYTVVVEHSMEVVVGGLAVLVILAVALPSLARDIVVGSGLTGAQEYSSVRHLSLFSSAYIIGIYVVTHS